MHATWARDSKASLDTWSTYEVGLFAFRHAVIDCALPCIQTNGGVAYIVDPSDAYGAFSAEFQHFVGAEAFPKLAVGSIKRFITITSKESLMAKLTVSEYAAKTGFCGLGVVEVNSVNDAEAWLTMHGWVRTGTSLGQARCLRIGRRVSRPYRVDPCALRLSFLRLCVPPCLRGAILPSAMPRGAPPVQYSLTTRD